jgi:hypothetical protein
MSNAVFQKLWDTRHHSRLNAEAGVRNHLSSVKLNIKEICELGKRGGDWEVQSLRPAWAKS